MEDKVATSVATSVSTYPSLNCYEIDENVRFGIWRSDVEPPKLGVAGTLSHPCRTNVLTPNRLSPNRLVAQSSVDSISYNSLPERNSSASQFSGYAIFNAEGPNSAW